MRFRSLIEHLQPRYSLPSRRYLLETALPELYNRVSTKLAEKLKGVPALSFTTDIWTSDVCPMSYLPVERSLFQPHTKSIIMIIIISKQSELWYQNSIGIDRYPNSGIGIGLEVKKRGSVQPYFKSSNHWGQP